MIEIEIPEEEVLKVRKADIEQNSRKEIILAILERGLKISTERFNQYQSDYNDKFFAFEDAKRYIEKNYVKSQYPNAKHWNLDYTTHILTIEE